MAVEEGASVICKTIEQALKDNTGCLIGRNGTIEMQVLFSKMQNPNASIASHLASTLELHAGIWPPTDYHIQNWYLDTLHAIRSSDVLVAGWYEPLAALEGQLLDTVNPSSPRIPLRSLEPYYVPPEKRWTQLLAGQRVAVVSSFAETAHKQIRKAEDIWPHLSESLLPSHATWIPIRTGYAPVLARGRAEWPTHIQNSEKAAADVVYRVMEAKARIAIIGCGGLGMPIASELKRRGVIAIVLGGATQVLFGIKGRRWETHSVIKHFWNEDWAWPAEEETPGGAKQIEGGCYWF